MPGKILEGIRVLDLSQFISGPYCSSYLADQGAEVIKVEVPPYGEAMRLFTLFDKQMSPLFSILNRNKKSITIDLSQAGAKDVFLNLVEKADVVLENFIPGTMKRWGVDYDVLVGKNPRLIYAAISGFGQTGPRSDLPAFDLVAQAAGGIMHASNITEGTPRIPFADYSSGLACALGIMQALFHRERTGEGQFVDLSMQDLMYSVNVRAQVNEFMDKARSRDLTARLLPTYNQYHTRDGKSVVLVTITENQFKRLMGVIGREELVSDERLSNVVKRMDHIEFLDEVLEAYTQKHDRDEIVKVMRENRIPCSPVVQIDEIQEDEQLAARGMFNRSFSFDDVARATIPNPVIKFSGSPADIATKAPDLGQHNEEVYAGLLSMDSDSLKKLKRRHVI
ncbi:MAG: CoA transferase [Candidatus Lokiarchaeota archaeon]|nr:CoA transferase [Candidatus Lokiarchaeota archaeon]